MSIAAALILAASTASAPVPEGPGAGGVQLASAPARATIVRAVVVRQASGLQVDRDGPTPQISRSGRTVLVEFQ
jgi:hypothetical protein